MKLYHVVAGRNEEKSITGYTVNNKRDLLVKKFWFIMHGFDFVEIYEF